MKRKTHSLLAALAFSAAPLLTGCEAAQQPVTPVRLASITEAVAATSSFDVLEAAVKRTNLTADLGGAGPFTLFAPTDAAFQAHLGAASESAAIATVNSLDGAALARILRYHVASGRLKSNTLATGPVPTLLNGASLAVQVGGGVKITGAGNTGQAASVTVADVELSNGLIHVIDRVLVPN